ncbi:MAG: peptide chain release factor 1 [Firmicutes bacterium]|jgi:peptide chain release factor 1|nr:peptide chain release factor 1 [Bacillota bacterium]
MLEKLAGIEKKYQDLTKKLGDPDLLGDPQHYGQVAKQHAELEEIVSKYQEYLRVEKELQDSEQMLADDPDPDMRELISEEIDSLQEAREKLRGDLRLLLLPKDPNDEKNVIVEIRGGTGGDEAALFAGDLFRMYSRYAERQNWRIELMNSNPTELGGFKEVIFMVEGHGAYSKLKYESGVHRVQRIPTTESGGRIHTSTATVAVLPEAQEVEVEIDPNDLRIDVYRSSGPGGQSVNTTDSAVRITHLPTGIVVSCQDEKSQHKNRDKAMRILRARLLDKYQQEQQAEVAQARKSQVGTGDRSERIRTYNFPQGRVTDHRINLTLYRIDAIMEGEIDELIDALQTAQQAEQLKAMEE